MRRVWLAAAVLVWTVPAWAATVQEHRQQLKSTRQDLRQERQELQDLKQRLRREQQQVRSRRKQERSILFELQRADQKIEEAEERYAEQQRNLSLLENRIADIQTGIAETEHALNELKQLLAARLRLLYRERLGGFWRMLASSPSLAQAGLRLKFLHVFASQNAHLIEDLEAQRETLEARRRRLSQRQTQARELGQQTRRTLDTIRRQKTSREHMLTKVRLERATHERAARELAAAEKRLNRLVAHLEEKTRHLQRQIHVAGLGFGKRRGTLSWPTRGRVISRFGKVRHPRFNTYVYNKGIDIAGSIGQNVDSVAKGRVLYAEWFEGYGRMIILDHGDGYNTIYAHLQTILVSEGDSVEELQAIGRLGDSGTWKEPSLYFEIRNRGEALNPQHWLKR